MGRVALTLAISDYDHVRDVTSGAVPVEGVELTCLDLSIEEIFYRFGSFREWDVSEMSLAKYASAVASGDTSVTAIPVFPSRIFRHAAIFVRRDGAVRRAGDLAGRRVGVPEWAQTATVYARGLLTHVYGVRLEDVEWVQAGVNDPGRRELAPIELPAGVSCRSEPDRSLAEMLVAGDLDAVIAGHAPASWEHGHPDVVRLFPDFQAVEEDYYRETGIYPIMHVVGLRSEVHERHPWVAKNLLTAFETAKRRSVARALDSAAPRFPVPWVFEYAQRARELFGEDFWPYGLEPNRRTLEAFLGFAHEQGVCRRLLEPEELFPPEVRSSYRV